MKSDWKLQFDSSLQEYYYINTVTNDISFDLPSEVKQRKPFFRRCGSLTKWPSLLSTKHGKSSEKSVSSSSSVKTDSSSLSDYSGETTLARDDSLKFNKLERPVVNNSIVDFNDESLIESSIFNTNYEFDSELNSIDSNDVVSFDGNDCEYSYYNIDNYDYDADDYQYHAEEVDYEKENERIQLRMQMLRELEI